MRVLSFGGLQKLELEDITSKNEKLWIIRGLRNQEIMQKLQTNKQTNTCVYNLQKYWFI